jgi:hypothetical protein
MYSVLWRRRVSGSPVKETLEAIVNTTKEEIQSLPQKLPDGCMLEDIQYHPYVIGKICKGIERAETEGAVLQEEAERRLGKWISE